MQSRKRKTETVRLTKRCCTCKQHKPLEEFHNWKNGKAGRAHNCKPCANATSRANHALRMRQPSARRAKRAAYVKTRHGVSLQEYEVRLAQQGYACAICHESLLPHGYGTHYDHYHLSGRFRAFLCSGCNRGLGYFNDNPALLRVAAEYVEDRT